MYNPFRDLAKWWKNKTKPKTPNFEEIKDQLIIKKPKTIKQLENERRLENHKKVRSKHNKLAEKARKLNAFKKK